MKKVLLLIAVLLFAISVCGCGSILDGEITVIKPYHVNSDDNSEVDNAKELNSFEDFEEALKELIINNEDSAVYKMTGVDRTDIEAELNGICRNYTLQDPLGSYATYYISCDVTPIISYDKVQVSIVYKHNKDDIESLKYIASKLYFEQVLRNNLRDYSTDIAFYTSLEEINTEYVERTVEELFRSNPLSIASLPKVNVSFYPANVGKHVVEVTFSYEYTRSVLLSMVSSLNEYVDKFIQGIEGENEEELSDYEYLSQICDKFTSKKKFVTEGTSDIYKTAYGVIINSIGTDEGYAMAFKGICDKLQIDCKVVKGSTNGNVHYWNIVKLDEDFYHIDVSSLFEEENRVFLLGDRSLKDNYMWDTTENPNCEHDYYEEIPNQENSLLPGEEANDIEDTPEETANNTET